jgi:hypothetical protein
MYSGTVSIEIIYVLILLNNWKLNILYLVKLYIELQTLFFIITFIVLADAVGPPSPVGKMVICWDVEKFTNIYDKNIHPLLFINQI